MRYGPLSRSRAHRASRRARAVGIVCNEFFDASLGRMGGFGWAAQQSAECLAQAPDLGFQPVLLAGRGGLADSITARSSNGIPLVKYDDRRRRYAHTLDRANVSLLLTVDYRPNYLPVLRARPKTPVCIWLRDPRTPEDVEKIASLEVPGTTEPPLGVTAIDCGSLGEFVEGETRARVVFASPAPSLAAPKIEATYGTARTQVTLMPNPVDVALGEKREAGHPQLVFLGRLDPIKRPWIFVELARRFPEAEFLMLGQSHFQGGGSWRPSRLPENVRLMGHVDGQAKQEVLRSAWAIVNTSIHESLPISFLEALHSGTPIVSCQDPEGVTSRFGIFVGECHGGGLEALDSFSQAVERLLEDPRLRLELGEAGREWVRATHTREAFVSAFAQLAYPLVQPST